MESIIRDVIALDDAQKRALEAVLGHELGANQRLVITVLEAEPTVPSPATSDRPTQSLSDWTAICAGLSEAQVEGLDAAVAERANFTRDAS